MEPQSEPPFESNPVLAIAATPIVACTAHNSICKVAEGGTVQEIKLQFAEMIGLNVSPKVKTYI